MKAIYILVLLVISIIIIGKKALYKLECSAIFHPKKLPKRHVFPLWSIQQDLRHKINKDITVTEHNVKTKDGVSINLIYMRNPHVRSHIIVAHGNAGNINKNHNVLSRLGKLASVVQFDYRGYGKSKGKPSEKGLYEDVSAVWTFLVHKNGVDPKDISLYGQSLGASVVAWLGQNLCEYDRIRPKAIIMESGFSSLAEVAKEYMPSFLSYLISQKFDSCDYVKRIGDKIPIIVAHSSQDEIIGFSHKDKILQNSSSKIKFHELKGGHNSVEYDDKYMKLISGYI